MKSPTGRLATSQPNMQNIPIRTPEGKKIRDAFLKSLGDKEPSDDRT